MAPSLERFLDRASTSLKICGVTRESDARSLVDLGVDAIGVNFWPQSKRYLDPIHAGWLKPIAGSILRVGVFVNESPTLAIQLVREGLIDVIQLHGDESPASAEPYRAAGIPFIKAIGVSSQADLAQADAYGAAAMLLDACAPGIYGGTGHTFDWDVASAFTTQHPQLPLILAGGITPENARMAIDSIHPAALDVASGAESSPGIKDLNKVQSLLLATRS